MIRLTCPLCLVQHKRIWGGAHLYCYIPGTLLHRNNTSLNSSVPIILYLRIINITTHFVNKTNGLNNTRNRIFSNKIFAVRYCGELFLYTVHMYLKKRVTATKIKVSANLPRCSFWLLVLVFQDIELFHLYQNPYIAT